MVLTNALRLFKNNTVKVIINDAIISIKYHAPENTNAQVTTGLNTKSRDLNEAFVEPGRGANGKIDVLSLNAQ